MQWCQALDIELVMFDPRMQDVILYGGKMHNDARLRRAQALATTNEHGLAITRYLLGEKISGQRDLLTLMERSVPRADELCYEIEEAASISACHRLESEAAVTYWRQWVDMPLQWHGAASRDIPAHWRTVGTRRSSRSQRSSDSQAQHAITPTHAILNYCYRLAEIETTIALRAVGLDPGLGIIHRDMQGRDSMTLDCLEAIRPMVDAYVYQLIGYRTFTRKDVRELPDGTCRLLPPFSHELTATMTRWRNAAAVIAENIANLLRPATASGRKRTLTPLTGMNLRRAQATIKATRGIEDRLGNRGTTIDFGEDLPRRDIWLGRYHASVQAIPTEQLVQATGLSKRYILLIKRKERVPDPRHWPAFERACKSQHKRSE